MSTATKAAPKAGELNKIVPSKVKAGDMMSITHFFKVKQTNGSAVIGTDLRWGLGDMKIDGAQLIESCSSADQFTSEEKVTMTAAASMLVSAYGRPFTVCFVKQEDGTDRVLRGRLIEPEPLLGRSKVEDLDIGLGEHRFRLVDHRTLKYIILDGVKYSVKK